MPTEATPDRHTEIAACALSPDAAKAASQTSDNSRLSRLSIGDLKRTDSLRAVHLPWTRSRAPLLRYLGIEIDDPLATADHVDV